MKRLTIILSFRNALVIGSLALAAPLLGGCALESPSGDGQNGAETGENDLVQGATDDPALIHNGTGGNLAVEVNHGVSLPSSLPLTQEEGSDGTTPQPQPWYPKLEVRSASESSGANHK